MGVYVKIKHLEKDSGLGEDSNEDKKASYSSLIHVNVKLYI